MELTVFLAVVVVIYLILWFFDSFFKSCMHYPYDAFLNGTGLTIKPFRIHWYTTALNRCTIKWAHTYPKCFNLSFDLGVLAALLLLPTVLLWQIMPFIVDAFTSKDAGPAAASTKRTADDALQFQLMLPGVNLPFDEIVFYTLAMGICSVVHEFGHAFAAVLEDVPLTGFGFNVLFILPMAYINISADHLNSLRAWPRLRILCAGVWHNILLAGFCFAVMSLLPVLLHPFYSINQSVIVKSMRRDSPLIGEKGLSVGDEIISINDCSVRNVDTWYACLVATLKTPPGYCIPSEYVFEHDETAAVRHIVDGIVECCDRSNAKVMCFEYINEDTAYSLNEIPMYMCLNIRNVMTNSLSYCQYAHNKCTDSFCIRPLMNNATTLMQLKRAGKPDVMYVGHPSDLARTVDVSTYVPKVLALSPNVADGIALLLKYVVVFSLGLATLNVIPCFYFDGYHIVNTIVNHCLKGLVPDRSRRDCITIAISSIGTIFLFATLLKSLWQSIFQYMF